MPLVDSKASKPTRCTKPGLFFITLVSRRT
nr:MAG TPA: hypothetical protein [Caudoviricetes sp.]